MSHQGPSLCALAVLGALLLLPGGRAGAAEHDWAFRAEAGAGVDTNPSRLAAGEAASGVAVGALRASDRVLGPDWGASLALAVAGRIYPAAAGSTALASRLDAAGSLDLSPGWSAGASLLVSDLSSRSGQLDEDLVRGDLSLRLGRPAWSAWLSGGWTRLAPRATELRPFLSSGPEAWLRGMVAPASRHRLSAGLGFAFSSYPRWQGPRAREDGAFTLSAGYGYRGPAVADLQYAFTASTSSVAGGAFERHRIAGRAALLLPADWTLAVRAALQRSRYPQRLSLVDQAGLPPGEESQDLAEARLSIPLGGPLELALSLSRSWGESASGAIVPVARTLATAGLAWREGPADR